VLRAANPAVLDLEAPHHHPAAGDGGAAGSDRAELAEILVEAGDTVTFGSQTPRKTHECPEGGLGAGAGRSGRVLVSAPRRGRSARRASGQGGRVFHHPRAADYDPGRPGPGAGFAKLAVDQSERIRIVGARRDRTAKIRRVAPTI